MRWYSATLYKSVEVEKNKLGTPIIEDVEAGSCALRQAPVSSTLKAIEGNDAHIVVRTFSTRKPAEEFAEITAFEFRGKKFRLTEVSDSMIGTIITGTYSKPRLAYENQYST